MQQTETNRQEHVSGPGPAISLVSISAALSQVPCTVVSSESQAGVDPVIGGDVQPFENGWQSRVDSAPFAARRDPARDIDQLEVLRLPNRQCLVRRGAPRRRERHQRSNRNRCAQNPTAVGGFGHGLPERCPATSSRDPMTKTSELRRLRACRDTSPDRIEVDVRHGGNQRTFRAQCLRVEAGLPEVAGAAVFPIGLSRDGFVEALHEPAEALEPLPKDRRSRGERFEFGGRECPTVEVVPHEQRASVQCGPTLQYLVVRPGRGFVRVQANHQVIVIAHDGVGAKLDTEDRTQDANAIFEPLSSVLETPSRRPVDPAQEGATDASRRHMVVRRLRYTHQAFSRSGHVESL